MRRTNYEAEEFYKHPLLPVVPIDEPELNPFKEDGVDMFAVLGYACPGNTAKFFGAEGMLKHAQKAGILNGITRIVEATSGAMGDILTGLALAEPYNIPEVLLVMRNDVPATKRYTAIFADATVIPNEPKLSPIETARKLGAEPGSLNLDQYNNPHNAEGYECIAAPLIIRQVPYLDGFCAPIGTGGTVIGFSNGLRKVLPKIVMIGAMCAPKQEIAGARELSAMPEILNPWQQAIDERIEVGTREAYLSALWFRWTKRLNPGPTGGMAHIAILKSLKAYKDSGELEKALIKKGRRLAFAVFFHDGFRSYIADRFPAFLTDDLQKSSTAPLPFDVASGKVKI